MSTYHVIYSAPRRLNKMEARQLKEMCLDWIATYAPGGSWIAWVKRGDDRFYLHLIVTEEAP